MKPCNLTCILALTSALGCSGHALAQPVSGNASGGTDASATADRSQGSATTGAGSSAAAKSNYANANMAGGTEVQATLTKPVDARRAKPGDSVTARTDRDAKAADGTTVPRGSTLVGHVTQAQPKGSAGATSGARSESTLGIVFDKAILKNGREVPLNLAIQAVSTARTAGGAAMDDSGAGMSAAGTAAALGGGAGRGLVSGVSGSAMGTVGAAGGFGRGIGGRFGASGGGMSSVVSRSAGAVGGLSVAGDLMAGSRGVFGLSGLNLAMASGGSAEGALITSSTRNVRLDGGTKMLLSSSAETANNSARASGQAAGAANAGPRRDATATKRTDKADKTKN